MWTAKKGFILDGIFDHIATIFTISVDPSLELLFLRLVDSLRNPFIYKQTFLSLTISDYWMPTMSHPGYLKITESEFLSMRRLNVNDGVYFTLFLCLYDRTHLNSYYYIWDNIISGEPMLNKYFIDLLKHLVRLYLWVNIIVFIELGVVLDDLFRLVLVGCKSLLYAVYVIVRTSACLSSLEQTIQHHFFATL